MKRLCCLCTSSLLVVIPACNPYDAQQGEFNAGPVDAADFVVDYKGVGAQNRSTGYHAALGTFTAIDAYANGSQAPYYRFPFTSGQLAGDPLRLLENERSPSYAPTPIAYAFDPAYPTSPFPSSPTCTAPNNYVYNERTDDMRLDEQSNIFTQLPIATQIPGVAATSNYIPVVKEVPLTAASKTCQSVKSEKTLKKVFGDPPAAPSGRYLLWAIIDPSAGVYRVGEQPNYSLPDGTFPNPRYGTGVGLQKWGWFGQYYLAYIDGGYIPLDPPTTVGGRQVVRMQARPLYVPSRISVHPVVTNCGPTQQTCNPGQRCVANNDCADCTLTGAAACATGDLCQPDPDDPNRRMTCFHTQSPGAFLGGDVFTAKRGDGAYSPVCRLFQYTATQVNERERVASEMPRDLNAVTGMDPSPTAVSLSSTNPPPYIYCPQVQ